MVPEETNFQFKRRKPPYFGISARKRQKMPTPPTRKRGNSEPPHESTRGHRKNCHKSAQKTQNGAAANKGWKIRMRTWPCASEELPRKDTKRTKQKGALSSAFL